MNNNGLVEYKEGFISKIKNFFKRIFQKKEENYNYVQEKTIKESNNAQNGFISDIKINTKGINTYIERKAFLKEIEGNAEALNMLSMDRLKKLDKYYDGVIEQNNEKIKKLKALA